MCRELIRLVVCFYSIEAVGSAGRTIAIDLPDHSPPRLTQAVLFLAKAATGR